VAKAPATRKQKEQHPTVKPTDTLQTALAVIAAGGVGLAVVTRSGRVAGTITDDQIRRAVLAGGRLEHPVAEVMTDQPVTVAPGARAKDIGELLTAYRMRAVPVVDKGRLVGLKTLQDAKTGPAPPVAVIMVGGRGERLRPYTDKVPKPLLKVGGVPIVERIIRAAAEAGVRTVYLAVNYKAEAFEDALGDGTRLGVELVYVRERKPLHTAGALSLLPEIPDGPLFVTNGDIITTVDLRSLFDFHWHHGGAITVCGAEHHTYVPYGVLRTVEHHLLSIDEKPSRTDFVSAGMYMLQPETLRFIPPDTHMGMPELIDSVIKQGLPVHVFPMLGSWFDIGSPEEFEKVLLAFATGEEG
jgi:dTDP-glucose pyrophosphorylase